MMEKSIRFINTPHFLKDYAEAANDIVRITHKIRVFSLGER